MTRLANACHRPFSNGTEERAWMSTWCDYCIHDHSMHFPEQNGPGCDLVLAYMVDPGEWPEAWLPEPDDGQFFLPSRMVCGQFAPCTEGSCMGDPGASERAERVAEVTAYWKDAR